jgi:hypothetical protein
MVWVMDDEETFLAHTLMHVAKVLHPVLARRARYGGRKGRRAERRLLQYAKGMRWTPIGIDLRIQWQEQVKLWMTPPNIPYLARELLAVAARVYSL